MVIKLKRWRDFCNILCKYKFNFVAKRFFFPWQLLHFYIISGKTTFECRRLPWAKHFFLGWRLQTLWGGRAPACRGYSQTGSSTPEPEQRRNVLFTNNNDAPIISAVEIRFWGLVSCNYSPHWQRVRVEKKQIGLDEKPVRYKWNCNAAVNDKGVNICKNDSILFSKAA